MLVYSNRAHVSIYYKPKFIYLKCTQCVTSPGWHLNKFTVISVYRLNHFIWPHSLAESNLKCVREHEATAWMLIKFNISTITFWCIKWYEARTHSLGFIVISDNFHFVHGKRGERPNEMLIINGFDCGLWRGYSPIRIVCPQCLDAVKSHKYNYR